MFRKFSVVIPTYKRKKLLKQAIISLAKNNYPKKNFEIIIINNFYLDKDVLALITKLKKKYTLTLRLINNQENSISVARNLGVVNSRYDYLIFIDDDIEVKENYFKSYNRAWKKYSKASILGGRITPKLENGKALSFQQEQLINKYPWCFAKLDYGNSDYKLRLGEGLYSGNMSIRKSNLNQLFFDRRLGKMLDNGEVIFAEDYELCSRCLIQKKEVIFIADQNLTVNNNIKRLRCGGNYLIKRHINAGKEQAIMDYILKKKFKEFKSIYLKPFLSLSGWQHLMRNPYEKHSFFHYLSQRFLLFFNH